ncbi:MAG: glycosyltransferase, partial [Oceanococcaceae bacterium]
LAEALNRPETGLAAPGIVDASGRLADHARELPTPLSVIGRRLGWADDAVPQSARIQDVPWLAGLFLAARRSRWQELGGFDERYRLYAEDVEVCLRCRNAGWRVMRLPEVAAAHHARRESKTNLQRFLWHAAGLARLWFSDTWRQYRQQSQP